VTDTRLNLGGEIFGAANIFRLQVLRINHCLLRIVANIHKSRNNKMPKQAKATKKFEKNRLKGTLERIKDFAKVKQRHKQKEKRQHDAAKRNEKEEQQNGANGIDSGDEPSGTNMDDDDFFNETIDVPEPEPASKSKNKKRKRDSVSARAEPDADSGQRSDQSEGEDDDEDFKGQLDALAEKDPEFYKYLKENDAELLDFDDNADLAEVDELSEDDADRPSKKQKLNEPENTELTLASIKKWKSAMDTQHSIRSLRQTVLAFRSAVHADDDEAKGKETRYKILDSNVYHEILVTALDTVPKVLAHHLPMKESASGKIRVSTESPKFKSLSPLIKSHISSLHTLLGQLSDSSTIRRALESLEPLLVYLLQFRNFLKAVVKSIAGIWSDNSSDESTRITAFLLLRRLMVVGDAGIRETVLKSTYEGVVKGARNVTELTLPGVNLMKNSAAELYGIDQKISYTTAFKYIRQLAMHLRTHVAKPTKDSYKMVYNWQFVHSLDFWSRVLSMHCNSLLEAQNGKESQLRPLIYPVVQITVGVTRLIPTSTYFPLRFQLMRALLRISQATGTYIPLAAALLEVLNSPELKKPAKAATVKPLDFSSNIRAPASYLKTRVYQDGLGEQLVELFSEFFVLWCKSIAYPELQLPVTVMLKRWLKTASNSEGNKNPKLNQSLLLVVQKSEANSRWIEERRNKVHFAPKDRAEVEAFLKEVQWEDTPFGAFVAAQRQQREERRKVVEQGRREEAKRKKARQEQEVDEDF
jgi:nucleolar complex protein 2